MLAAMRMGIRFVCLAVSCPSCVAYSELSVRRLLFDFCLKVFNFTFCLNNGKLVHIKHCNAAAVVASVFKPFKPFD